MSRTDRAVFRLPAAALFVPVIAAFLIIPLATMGGAWAVLFVVPVIAVVWMVVTRTTATADRVTAHGLRGSRRMAWADLDRLEIDSSRWVVAVGTDGRRLRLPMVRTSDLRRFVAASGGTLTLGFPDDSDPEADEPDPTAEPSANQEPNAHQERSAAPGAEPGAAVEAAPVEVDGVR